MKRAVALPQYSDTKEFVPPEGIVEVRLDKATNLLADGACPSNTYDAAFLDGTQPTDTCDHANGDQRNLFQRIFGLGEKPAAPQQVPITPTSPQLVQPIQPAPTSNAGVAQNQPPPEPQPVKKKRGFFSRLFGGKRDDDQNQQQPAPQPNPPAPPQ
jgi:penicillin-binding protein 1B